MAINYLEVIGRCFPGSEAYTGGDPTNYNDLIWVTTPVSQATLDASQCAQVNYNPPVFGRGVQRWYGRIVQQAGTTKFNDTLVIPPVTEGSEVWTKTIELLSPKHKVAITNSMIVDSSRANAIVVAFFRDTTCISSTIVYVSGASKPTPVPLVHIDDTGTTISRVYSCRIGLMGVNSNGTWYINRLASGDTLGNTSDTQSFLIEEFE